MHRRDGPRLPKVGPVDCIYEGGRSLYIHPDECVDCGACEPVWPVEAIYYEDDLPEKWQIYTEDNARFFGESLPGRDTPLGSPGGAGKLAPLGADTPLVAGHPALDDAESSDEPMDAPTPSNDVDPRPEHWPEHREDARLAPDDHPSLPAQAGPARLRVGDQNTDSGTTATGEQ